MHLISRGYAFTSISTTSTTSNNRRSTLFSSVETSESSNKPNWEVKQHLYGLDMIKEKESGNTAASVTMDADGSVNDSGEALPLPQTYITCGNCKSLFAIDEADLGDRGKGW
jgi:hypothetical protein